jgi:hypothetical protein
MPRIGTNNTGLDSGGVYGSGPADSGSDRCPTRLLPSEPQKKSAPQDNEG